MSWIKRLQKLESKLATLPRESPERQQASPALVGKPSELFDRLCADIWNLKVKAEADGNWHVAFGCVRVLLQNVVHPLASGNSCRTAEGVLSSDLDHDVAIRLARTYLVRHDASSNPKPETVASPPEEAKNSDLAEQSSVRAVAVSEPEVEPPAPATRRYEVARQLPPAWMSSKW